jgi:beta-lactamase class A
VTTSLQRVGTGAAALLLAVSLSPPATAGGARWRPTLDAAIEYAQGRAGSISFAAIGTGGHLHGYRGATTVPMVSVIKVMFLVAYLRMPSVRERDLRDSERAMLGPMIRRSDNTAATQIANIVGPSRMYRLARRAEMRDFSYTRPWGSSRTSARDQARFLFELRTHIPRRHRAYAFRLLANIVDSQRWGIGRVATPGWRKLFKGGWGSGSGAVDHQVVQLRRRDGTHVSVAVMTTGSPSHDYAKRTLRRVFGKLLADLP